MDPDLFEKLRLELRRGSLTVAVLLQLRSEHYGYTLRKSLAERGLDIDESTLYPLLRRLESQGLLTSEWREEDRRNKRFYRIADLGLPLLDQLLAEWGALNAVLTRLQSSSYVACNPAPAAADSPTVVGHSADQKES